MRIALLQPTYWPEVRRGSERLVHDLGVTLAQRGHDVTLVTSHRAAPRTAYEDGVRVIRTWRPPERTPLSWYEHHVAHAPSVIWHLLRGGYDAAHAFFAVDGWAAIRARGRGGPPVAFSFHGIPARAHLVRRRYRLELLEACASRADHVSVLSRAAAEGFRLLFGREPHVLPGGVFDTNFAVDVPRAAEPTLFCAASLGDPRKRGPLLFRGFERLRQRRPNARLLVARAADPVMSGAALPELPPGAEWIDVDETHELAVTYSRAWASVLPAVEEAFGLVLVESLAAGTPVVAARSGACPEIVTSERLGRLFAPDDVGALAAAMDEALELGRLPDTPGACRRAASRHAWHTVVRSYERAYRSLSGGPGEERRVGDPVAGAGDEPRREPLP